MLSSFFPRAFFHVSIFGIALASLVACGGSEKSSATASSASGGSSDQTPGARCLAIASAKRESKAGEPAKITAKHILVKYAGSKRAPETVTRTRDEACLRALEARGKLEAGASFAEVVATYSEEPGASTREGSLGSIERTSVVPAFADAAFELQAGEVSHVVETDFGFHVIMRTQ